MNEQQRLENNDLIGELRALREEIEFAHLTLNRLGWVKSIEELKPYTSN